MLDINLFRNNPDTIREALSKRQMDTSVVDEVITLDIKRRSVITEAEQLKAERNSVSKEIGKIKDKDERQLKINEMREVGDKISNLDNQVREIEGEIEKNISGLPNIPDPKTPLGKTEEDNVVIKQVGDIPTFDFLPLPHWDLGPQLGIIDFERGVKITGSRFYFLSGDGARLQRALISFMLDLHRRQGYLEKYPPFMVKGETLYGSGQLPKFADNLYKDHEEDLWMVPTAEVPLTGYHAGDILEEESLPKHYTAYTPCFRREKMSAGRDVRGIKRGHQFDKVEMYTYCKPEESDKELEKMLVRRGTNLCNAWDCLTGYYSCVPETSDLGPRSHMISKIWAAGCGEWLEASSISNVTDFQARRANIKYRPEDGKSLQFVHTLNGSGLGMPRTMIAVLENYQKSDGSVEIPEVLRPWMGNQTTIEKQSL